MTIRTFQKRGTATATAGLVLLVLGLASAASAQPPAERQYRIRPRIEEFVKSQTLAVDSGDDDLQKARKARLNAALGEMMERTRDSLRESVLIDGLLNSELRVLEAELDYYEKAPERIRVLEKHFEISRDLAAIVEERSKADLATGAQVEYARYCRSSVEVALWKARCGTVH